MPFPVAVEGSLLPQGATRDGLLYGWSRNPSDGLLRGPCAWLREYAPGFRGSLSAGFGRTRSGRSSAAAGDPRPKGGLWDSPDTTSEECLDVAKLRTMKLLVPHKES